MEPEVVRYYRNLTIQLVLATDFSKHFKHLVKFKLIYCGNYIEPQKNVMLKMLMHCADISNSTRKWDIYYQWAQNVLEEFFLQGDREKELGLSISPLCDRHTTNFSKCQMSFIDLFVIPVFGLLKDTIPGFDGCYKNALVNKQKLLSFGEDKEKEMLTEGNFLN